MSSYCLRWSWASCRKLMDNYRSDMHLLALMLQTGSLSLSSSIWLACIHFNYINLIITYMITGNKYFNYSHSFSFPIIPYYHMLQILLPARQFLSLYFSPTFACSFKKSTKPVVIYGTEFCGPCNKAKKYLN